MHSNLAGMQLTPTLHNITTHEVTDESLVNAVNGSNNIKQKINKCSFG